MKLNSSDVAKVKKSNVKVTKSNKICAQNHQMYAANVIRQWKYTRFIENRGRGSEWQGHIFDRKFITAVSADSSFTILS